MVQPYIQNNLCEKPLDPLSIIHYNDGLCQEMMSMKYCIVHCLVTMSRDLHTVCQILPVPGSCSCSNVYASIYCMSVLQTDEGSGVSWDETWPCLMHKGGGCHTLRSKSRKGRVELGDNDKGLLIINNTTRQKFICSLFGNLTRFKSGIWFKKCTWC